MKPCSTKHLHSLALVLSILVAGISAPTIDAWAVVSRQPDDQLESVRKEIKSLQSTLNRSRTERGELQNTLKRIETELGELNASIRTIDSEVKSGQRELKKLKSRRSTLQSRLSEQRGLLANQVRAAYAMGRQEQIKMLLNQQDPARVGRVLIYYDLLNRARAKQIEEVTTTLRELDGVELEITRQNVTLTTLRERKISEQKVLSEGRQARKQLLKRINKEIKSQGRQLAGLKEDEQRLMRLLEELARRPQAENAERTPFAKLRGKLQWPTKGRISARFGDRRPVGALRWQGMLIDAPEGREVQAISHGRVAFADWLRGFGLLIIIDHGDGFMSLYGHNQSLFKETGEWVETGESIASVGASGGQSEASLYFEIRQDGHPVNPQRWCRRIKGLKVGMNWHQ